MYRKSLPIIVLFALTIVNGASIGKPISDPTGILKAKVSRGEALTPAEERIAREHGLFPASTNNTTGNSSRDATTGGPDNFGYTWINSDNYLNGPTYTWIDTAGATSIYAGSLGDETTVKLDIPFPFYFYGSWPDSVTVSTNGWAGFSPSYTSAYLSNDTIPSDYAYGPNNMAAPLWDDWVTTDTTAWTVYPSGTMYHRTTGNAPNRQFTIIWWEIQHYSYPVPASTEHVSFEMVLNETTNNIVFQYHDVIVPDAEDCTYNCYDNGASATVGIENYDGTDGLLYGYNGNPQMVYDGMAIEFIAPEPLAPAPIFFSEYAEGSSNNKYLEIYNPTDPSGSLPRDVSVAWAPKLRESTNTVSVPRI